MNSADATDACLSQGHSDWVTDVSITADRKLVASASKVTEMITIVDDDSVGRAVMMKKMIL